MPSLSVLPRRCANLPSVTLVPMLALIALSVPGCSPSAGHGADAAVQIPDAEMPTDAGWVPGDPCSPDTLSPGRHAWTLDHDGLTRRYAVYLPAAYGETPMPLVLNLHPLTLGGALHLLWTNESRMNVKAEQEGFIVVQPDGTGSPASWNGGQDCCAPATTNDIDDVGFITALLDHLTTRLCLDDRRVYATGMSNGAFLSHRLACELPERFAAIAPVVGALSSDLACAPGRSVPLLQISGTEDGLVDFAQIEAGHARWVAHAGCTEHTVVSYQQGSVTCTTHDECDDDVEITHCVVDGGGHCWFNGSATQLIPGCSANADLETPDAVWEFLSRWSL